MRFLFVSIYCFSFVALPAFSQVYLSPNISYSSFERSLETDSGEVETKGSQLLIDLHFGYVMQGFYVGGLYTSSSGGDPTDTRTGFGVGLGYIKKGWFFRAAYLLQAQLEDAGSSSTATRTGTGLLVDLGYQWRVGSSFSIGPHLAYQSYTYTKAETDGTEVDQTFKDTQVFPLVGMSFLF